MALPTSAIERLAQEPIRSKSSYRDLLLLSGGLFFLSLFIYVGLSLGYEPYLQSRVEKSQADILNFNSQIPKDQFDQTVNFYSQVSNVRTLLAKHIFASTFFSWLEGQTQGNISYSQLGLNVQSNQISLTGVGKSLQDVGEQVALFEQDPRVSHIQFNNVSAGANGTWQFTMTLTVSSTVFKSPPTSS